MKSIMKDFGVVIFDITISKYHTVEPRNGAFQGLVLVMPARFLYCHLPKKNWLKVLLGQLAHTVFYYETSVSVQ